MCNVRELAMTAIELLCYVPVCDFTHLAITGAQRRKIDIVIRQKPLNLPAIRCDLHTSFQRSGKFCKVGRLSNGQGRLKARDELQPGAMPPEMGCENVGDRLHVEYK